MRSEESSTGTACRPVLPCLDRRPVLRPAGARPRRLCRARRHLQGPVTAKLCKSAKGARATGMGLGTTRLRTESTIGKELELKTVARAAILTGSREQLDLQSAKNSLLMRRSPPRLPPIREMARTHTFAVTGPGRGGRITRPFANLSLSSSLRRGDRASGRRPRGRGRSTDPVAALRAAPVVRRSCRPSRLDRCGRPTARPCGLPPRVRRRAGRARPG